MMQRTLGQSEIVIGPLMLGGNVFGWTAGRDASFAIIDRFLDAGLNAIDTADIYSGWVQGHVGGESEAVIGEWVASRCGRHRIVIASKVGAAPSPVNGRWDCTLTAAHIIRSVEGSLARLKTDYIDLYQAHGDDPRTPIEETMEAFDRLVRAGKVLAIGASHFSAARLEEVRRLGLEHSLARIDAVQTRYSLAARDEFEGEIQETCFAQKLAGLCYGALAKGFLTGKFRRPGDLAGNVYSDFIARSMDARGQRILDALERISLERSVGMAAVALAWVIARPGVTAAIAAVDTIAQLDEILPAATLRLTSDELNLLTKASAPNAPTSS